MDRLRQLITDAVAAGTCVRIVLSRPRGKQAQSPERVTLRPVDLAGGRRYQLATRAGGQETHENIAPDTVAEAVVERLHAQFLNCHVLTTSADWSARIGKDGALRLTEAPASHPVVATRHDRERHYLIPDGRPCPFLVETGVMSPNGRVRQIRRRKFRQINRFLELVNDIVDDLPQGRALSIVDYGCGKSYLTFALHHLLTAVHGRDVSILGLDRNEPIVRECVRIAEKLACRGLEFRVGDISDDDRAGPLDLAVSLHACDTATDDALAHAADRQAAVILAVPCCQHELAPQISSPSLAPLLSQGVLRERLAALATDSLRALALEARGYRTQIVEFIDMEHTAKNVLIRAVRRPGPAGPAADSRAAYDELKAALGLQQVRVDRVHGG